MKHDENLYPIVRFATPTPMSKVASGLASPGKPNNNGQEFTITVEVVQPVNKMKVMEGSSFSPSSLPNPNPHFPGLSFTYDTDFILPNGKTLPAGTNLAALFQYAGSHLNESGQTVTVFTWFVGGSVPQGTNSLTMTASATDASGRKGKDSIAVRVKPNTSGGDFTPDL